MPLASPTRTARLAGLLAVLSITFFVLLMGKPYFTNASRPPRGIRDSLAAIQVARDIPELDDILSDSPSPDREVMRFKQYIDFGFIAVYTGLFLTLAVLLGREGGWARVAGTAAAVCAAGVAVFNAMQDAAIIRILDVRLAVTTAGAINAIRGAAAAKWALAALTLALLSSLFLKKAGWLSRLTGVLLILAAASIVYGFRDNRFFVYQGYAAGAALIAIAVLSLRGGWPSARTNL
ncbi:MAG TPA: hypothetical protein VH639_19200 [Bryobacteraceae bacterium]|jgi:hypothetical protein